MHTSNVLFDTWRISFYVTSGNNYDVCMWNPWVQIGKPGNQLTYLSTILKTIQFLKASRPTCSIDHLLSTDMCHGTHNVN